MNHRRASASLGCFLLLVLFPLCASAAPKDPCKLLQRDLDQQIDDLKAWQKLDLQECYKVSGSDSDACRQLQDRHAQDLRMFRDNRAYQMANCRGPQPRSLAATSPFENNNHDFNDSYEEYYRNPAPCVEYPYVNCEQYDHYVHAKYHHHHHGYTEPATGGVKSATTYAEKPSKAAVPGNADKSAKSASEYVEKHGMADKSARQDTVSTRSSGHDTPAQSSHRGSAHDNSPSRSSGHDNSPAHSAGRNDSASTATSHNNHDSGGASNSGGSHASGAGSDVHASPSSASPSSSGASHSSGGGGSSSGSSSPAASSSAGASGGGGVSAPSPPSTPSHDSGGSRPK